MKTPATNRRAAAMTLLEVLIVIFVVALLAGLFLPALAKSNRRRGRINCISNLKQISLAFRMWSGDHGDKFPWQVSITQTGTLEFAESPQTFRHFQAASNELNSPKVLVCPTDTQRTKVVDFGQLNNEHLSYLVGLDVDEGRPQTILSGDRNITGAAISNGIMRLDAKSRVGFGPDLHKNVGNLALGDGSAAQVISSSFRKHIQSALLTQTNLPVMRLAIPQ